MRGSRTSARARQHACRSLSDSRSAGVSSGGDSPSSASSTCFAPPALLCGGDTAGEHAVGSHPDVLQHRARFDDEDLLEDGGDAGRRGAPRESSGSGRSRLPAERAGVGPVNAGEDLHERRLAGAVLTDDAVDLTSA